MERTTINISCGSTSASITIESVSKISQKIESEFVKDFVNQFYFNAHEYIKNNFPELRTVWVSTKLITPDVEFERSLEVKDD